MVWYLVLAMNVPIFCMFDSFDPSKNYLLSPHPYEFKNYSGFTWCYFYLQLVSGEVQDITLYYNHFHHQVLAMNVTIFCMFDSFDPTNICSHAAKDSTNYGSIFLPSFMSLGNWYKHHSKIDFHFSDTYFL
jgi:hypothetical protein